MGGINESTQQARLNRRVFLLGAMAGVVSVGLMALDRHPMLAQTGQRSLADLRFADFLALQGQPFTLSDGSGQSSVLQLTAVKQLKQGLQQSVAFGQECFSLTFCTPKANSLPQGSYQFAHHTLGRFELFIVPTQAVEHEERYIAIFNRIYPQ